MKFHTRNFHTYTGTGKHYASFCVDSIVVVVSSVVEIAIAVVVFRSLNNGFCEDLSLIGNGVIISTLIDVSVMLVRSHLSPRYPAGHSHEKWPSSLVNDVHFPPF